MFTIMSTGNSIYTLAGYAGFKIQMPRTKSLQIIISGQYLGLYDCSNFVTCCQLSTNFGNVRDGKNEHIYLVLLQNQSLLPGLLVKVQEHLLLEFILSVVD